MRTIVKPKFVTQEMIDYLDENADRPFAVVCNAAKVKFQLTQTELNQLINYSVQRRGAELYADPS